MPRIISTIALAISIVFITNIAHAQGVSYNTTGTAADASAMLDVVSDSKGVLVPRMDSTHRATISAPATGLLVYQTNGVTPGFYYFNGSVWTSLSSGAGSSSLPMGSNGQVLQLVSGSPTWVGNTLTIGASYGGGKVAYILQPGDAGYSGLEQHGLIASTSDLSAGTQWSTAAGTYTTTSALGTGIGTGKWNTVFIVANQGEGSYAAAICNSYTGGGYSDWYLPGKDELNKLYINRVAIGGFAGAIYWSSSEYTSNLAWVQLFITGFQSADYKNYTNRVRAIRSF